MLLGVAAFALAASVVFTWASSKSGVWNIGFAVVLVLMAATALIIAIRFTFARLGY